VAKYKNKYRIESTRLQNWDYGWPGSYFITICTKNRNCYFGDIENDKIQLSHMGVIADLLWHEIPNHSKNVKLGEFVVMPNHVHGILVLENGDLNASNELNASRDSNASRGVETGHALSLPKPDRSIPNIEPNPINHKSPGQSRFQNIGKNTVSSIIGGYKSAVTKHANRLGYEFAWQTRFWDVIIRKEIDYVKISKYIIDNPKKWRNDKLNGGKGNQVLEPIAGYGEEDWMV